MFSLRPGGPFAIGSLRAGGHLNSSVTGRLPAHRPVESMRLSPSYICCVAHQTKPRHRARTLRCARLPLSRNDCGECGGECFGAREECFCLRGAVKVGEQVRAEVVGDEAIRELANGDGVFDR
jgi:hypothetical protein